MAISCSNKKSSGYVYRTALIVVGPRRRYGAKIDYQAIPEQYRVTSYQEQKIRTDIYQATMLHKSFAPPLNVVIVVKTNLQTGAHAHTALHDDCKNLTTCCMILSRMHLVHRSQD